MKKKIKKISLILLILFVCACSNTNKNSSGSEGAEKTQFSIFSKEEKESFSNTLVAKFFKKYIFYKIPSKDEILKDEYTSIEELLKNTYPNRWKAVIENSKKDVEEAEKIANTKFFRAKDRDGFPNYIYFGIDDPEYDFATIYISDNFVSPAEKYSTKKYIEEGSLFNLNRSLRDSLDIKSLGLAPATTEKLLEAQNYKGL